MDERRGKTMSIGLEWSGIVEYVRPNPMYECVCSINGENSGNKAVICDGVGKTRAVALLNADNRSFLHVKIPKLPPLPLIGHKERIPTVILLSVCPLRKELLEPELLKVDAGERLPPDSWADITVQLKFGNADQHYPTAPMVDKYRCFADPHMTEDREKVVPMQRFLRNGDAVLAYGREFALRFLGDGWWRDGTEESGGFLLEME